MTCPRCNGFVYTQLVAYPNARETRCLMCGWYYHPPLPPLPEEHRGRKRWGRVEEA